jgi:uncharacterized protein (DUF2225 family)/CRP-like cAMP-binding protein
VIKLKSKNFIIKQFSAGDVIAAEGNKTNSLCIVMDGSVGIYKNYDSAEEKKIKTMGNGNFFGEIAFFSEKKLIETAVAEKNCSALLLDRTDIYKLFMYEPEVSAHIFKTLFDTILELYTPLIKSNTKEVVSSLSGKKTHESNPDLFFPLGGDFYSFNINKTNESYFKAYNPQTVIFKEEDEINSIYIVLKGSTGIYQSRKKIANIIQGNFVSKANFLNGVATETFAVVKETDMLVLSPDNIEKFFKNEPKSAFSVLKLFINRIEQLNNFIDTLKYGRQILPMNHKKYSIKIETDEQFLQSKFYFCPVCQNSFKSLIVNTNQLLSVSSDDDSRLYYEGVEPLYYDVISCPKCWYTAVKDNFDKGMATLPYFQKTMGAYYKSMQYNTDKSAFDIDDVFLAYYFAMFCISECFNTGRSLLYAKICLRLSWLYNICGDEEQEKTYVKKAREFFLAAFGESAPDDSRQAMGLMIVMGVVCFKVGDKKNAKFFLTNVVLKSSVDELKEKAKGLLKKFDLIPTN